MVWSMHTAAVCALAFAVASVERVVANRFPYPLNHPLQRVEEVDKTGAMDSLHHRLQVPRMLETDLGTEIESFFLGSGFPKQGRTLQQKIDEADAFLNEQLAKVHAIGVSTAIVYKDQVVYAKGYGVRRYNDSTTAASPDDISQIGSVTKTFIALAIGLLVEDGKLAWTDPVKQHLPWLKLVDKYAEEHVRVGDLLSMNSGLGRGQDPPIFVGGFDSQRNLVKGLEFAKPNFPLRDTPAYANANYEILGQVIEEVSGTPWARFLDKRVWKPLNMTHTFGALDDVPTEWRATKVNAGHYICDSDVVGPLSMYNTAATNITLGYKHLAAGSIVSSANDMAKLLRLVLNKGTVDGVQLFKSPSTIAEMITGKNKVVQQFDNGFVQSVLGVESRPDGNSISAGYGFDFVGHAAWGHGYLDKGGDTFVHHTTTAYAPNDGLALVMLVNSEGSTTITTNQFRSYVLGIFLDVPKDVLDFQFAKWQSLLPPNEAPIPGAPACGFPFWKDPPRLPIPLATIDALVGVYEVPDTTPYLPKLTVSRGGAASEIRFQVGLVNMTADYVATADSAFVFLPQANLAVVYDAVQAVPNGETPGEFVVQMMGLKYRKL